MSVDQQDCDECRGGLGEEVYTGGAYIYCSFECYKKSRGESMEKQERKCEQEQYIYSRGGCLDVLIQLFKGGVWDGDVASKAQRDWLFKRELIDRIDGFQIITKKGVALLMDLGVVKPS